MNKKIFIIAGIIVLVLIVSIFVFLRFIDSTVVDKGGMINYREHELTGVRYSSSGSMEGGFHYLELLPDEHGQLWITEEMQAGNGTEIKTKRIQATEEDLAQIRQLCVQYEALILGELEYSDLILLDAATDRVTFYLQGTEMITISSQHELPENSSGIIYAVYQALKTMLQE